MGLLPFLVVYLFGGLTFIPLVLAAILAGCWATLPQVDGNAVGKRASATTSIEKDGQVDTDAGTADRRPSAAPTLSDDDAATGCTFAVLRSYHLPSAIAALNARNNTVSAPNGTGTNGNDGLDGNATDPTAPIGTSESVYQSMYRTVFDRRKNASTSSVSVLDHQSGSNNDMTSTINTAASAVRRKPVVNASVFYIVIRHGHLILYDSPAQIEVRHVISLAHHNIALSDGEATDEPLMDADLFIKRTAIVLTPISTHPFTDYPTNSSQLHSKPKPFFLFSITTPEKEDFYHALLAARSAPPVPLGIPPDHLAKLQSSLHSSSLTPETRAFNALIGRIFLAVSHTTTLENFVRSKIEKRIARVQKPTFIASLTVQAIDLGDAAPILSAPRLKDFNISGDMTLALDIKYTGCASLVLSAVARIDLGARIKARTIDLLLSTSVRRIVGKLLVRVKPPPSNRMWLSFESMPDMEIHVEPIISTRKVAYGFVLRAIEERIRMMVSESLVKPNWDDVPFFDTRGQSIRGGIWADEGERDGEEPSNDRPAAVTAEALGRGSEKSKSMPTLNAATTNLQDVQAESSAASSGSDTPGGRSSDAVSSGVENARATMKRRSVGGTLPLQSVATEPKPSTSPPSSTFRSPSFISPPPSTPSVALAEASGVPVRSDEAGLQPPPRRRWRTGRASNDPPTARKDAVEVIREVRDRSIPDVRISAEHGHEDLGEDDPSLDSFSEDQQQLSEEQEDLQRFTQHHGRGFARTDSDRSVASTMSSGALSQRQQQRKTILSGAAAATKAAQNWGWNAIQNRRAAMAQNSQRRPSLRTSPMNSRTCLDSAMPAQAHHDEPMGRGQPLPPPGTPLPTPAQQNQQRTLLAGLSRAAGAAGAAAVAGAGTVGKSLGTGSVKRKPVPALPPRREKKEQESEEKEKEQGKDTLTLDDHEASSAKLEDAAVTDQDEEYDDHSQQNEVDEALQEPLSTEDEFGPWRENDGAVRALLESETNGDEAAPEQQNQVLSEAVDEIKPEAADGVPIAHESQPEKTEPEIVAAEVKPPTKPPRKVPPPLPARRKEKKPPGSEEMQLPRKEASGPQVTPSDGPTLSEVTRSAEVDLIDLAEDEHTGHGIGDVAMQAAPSNNHGPRPPDVPIVEHASQMDPSPDRETAVAAAGDETQREELLSHVSPAQASEGERKPAVQRDNDEKTSEAEQKFMHGQDVSEDDFEHNQRNPEFDGGANGVTEEGSLDAGLRPKSVQLSHQEGTATSTSRVNTVDDRDESNEQVSAPQKVVVDKEDAHEG